MKKRVLLLAACFSLLFISIPVNAQPQKEESETTEVAEVPSLTIDEVGNGEKLPESCNSILQVVITYTTEEGENVAIQGGSGFLIGNDEEQLQYLVTTKTAVVVPDAVLEQIKTDYGIEKDKDIKTNIEIVINKDVTVSAQIVTSSEEMDFAILQLGQSLHDREALLLNDKKLENYLRQTVFAIGYPSAAQYGEEKEYYISDDLQRTEGFLETEEIVNGQKYVKHHIFPNYGNIGGPIVDETGAILALNQSMNDGKSFYALEIKQIMNVCDSLGIPYKTVTMQEAEQAAVLAAIVHKEKLISTIAAAEEIELNDYKKKTIGNFVEDFENAQKIKANEDATQEQVDEAERTLQSDLEQLVPKTPLSVIISIIGGIIVFLGIVVLIVLRLTREKRARRREQKKAEFTVTQPAPDFSKRTFVEENSYKDLIQAGNGKIQNHIAQNADSYVDEPTGVLDNCAQDMQTTVLRQQEAILLREKNHENIILYKFPFVIGKEKEKTNYCVIDNPAVSRIHATIYMEGNMYYIEDNHATNGTFVNGTRMKPNTKVALKNNDCIALGNEKFMFALSVQL